MSAPRLVDPVTARPGSPARAVVSAAGRETPYLRAGRGSPVVLVAADLDAADVREMMLSLAREHLVLAAAPGVPDVRALAAWLRNFIEGLGVGDAHVLLHASLPPTLVIEDNGND